VVTGGSGLLGATLIDALRAEHQVVSLDLDGDPHSPHDVEFICADLTSDDSVDRAMRRIEQRFGPRIASVVHLAAYYDFAGRASPLYEAVTVEGTRRLMRALQRFHVEQFVFSSTMLVHRPTTPGNPIDEADDISATWAYPRSKVETEEVVERIDAADRHAIVRLAGVYDEMGHSPPISNQVKRIEGRWVTSHFYPAPPDRGQSFVHLDDAVDALARIVARRARLPQRFEVLVGEPDTVGYGELQDLIAHQLHGVDHWRTFRIPAPLAKAGAWAREHNPFGEDPFIRSWMVDRADDHYELDISTAREQLGWEPHHDIRSAVAPMIANLRADRRRWYAENDLRPPRRRAQLAP
jgi:nucleoside-diphosphate-sugar epimerase